MRFYSSTVCLGPEKGRVQLCRLSCGWASHPPTVLHVLKVWGCAAYALEHGQRSNYAPNKKARSLKFVVLVSCVVCCAVVKKKNLIFLCDWIFVSFGSFGLQFAFLDCPQQMLQESERIFFFFQIKFGSFTGLSLVVQLGRQIFYCQKSSEWNFVNFWSFGSQIAYLDRPQHALQESERVL